MRLRARASRSLRGRRSIGSPKRPEPSLRGVFVTGTDTGVGKSVVAAAMCAALAERGERVAAFKPAVTGLDEAAGDWGPDHELLAGAASADQSPADVAPYRFGPPVSPHYAAELERTAIEPRDLLRVARAAGAGADALVVEGVGGLMVPLTKDYLVRDLAIDLALPVVIAARAGVGTVSHTLLTLDAARGASLLVAGIVMSPWPERPSGVEQSNRETLERLADLRVSGLPPADPTTLAWAGARLPLGEWFE